jgi:hypothetical protein
MERHRHRYESPDIPSRRTIHYTNFLYIRNICESVSSYFKLLSNENVGLHDGGNEECFVPQLGDDDDGESCEESMQESIV